MRQTGSRWPRKLRRVFWIGAFAVYSVTAAGVMIDAISDNYRELSQVAQTTVDSPDEIRRLGAAQIAAVYRAQSGAPFATLPPGSTFKVIWPDGSSEYVMVVSQASSTGIRPIPGTQRPAPDDVPPSGQLQLLPVSAEPARGAPQQQQPR
ncbi:hypothetical protein [Luteimonas huabeiensis]|uniref:hypothetical protein n=1 Tax=Luteimonas huabeiensis TaxID=1244513 RepID=UPI000464785E|nr:hypothetical protein [Luteimonas huabeiensis]